MLSWPEIRRGTPLRALIDLVQYGVAIVLLVLAAIVLVKSFIDFVTSLNNYPTPLISAVDGVLVVIILIDIMRTVLTHLEGWGFPVSTLPRDRHHRSGSRHSGRLDAADFSSASPSGGSITQSLFELGTNAGVILVLALALFLTRGQNVDAETDPRQ